MSLTRDESAWMDWRGELTADEKDYITFIMEGILDDAVGFNLKLAKDDRVARVEAALIRYVIQSRA